MTSCCRIFRFSQEPLCRLVLTAALFLSSAAYAATSTSCEGKPITDIAISLTDIYDQPDAWLYRTANKLKINTHEEVVRNELIIKVGEPFSKFAADESVRNLRSLGYLNNVSIEAKPSSTGCNVIVYVQDTWTFIPQVGFSGGTGQNTFSAGVSESDLLGTGNRAELLYREQAQRQSVEAVYQDQRVGNSSNRLLAGVFNRSDGNRFVGRFGSPYRTLLDDSSWLIAADASDTLGRLWKNGDENYLFGQDRADVILGFSKAFERSESLVQRAGLGWHFTSDQFSQATLQDYKDLDLDPVKVSNDPRRLAENRRFSGLELTYERITPNYFSSRYIDRFERVQDFNLGQQLLLSTTVAPKFTGSRNSAGLFNALVSQGTNLSERGFLRGEIGVASRLVSGTFENTLARTEIKFAHVFKPTYVRETYLGQHTLAGGFALEYGDRLDKDRELLIGSDNALRGYSANSFSGDKRIVLNVEDRIHLVSDLYKLVSVGAAVFFDAGSASRSPLGDMFANQIYSDVGVGLRFAFPRSSGGRVFRIDVALPLRDADDGSKRFEPRILFSGGQLFDMSLRSENVGPEKSNVEVGIEK